MGEQIEIATGAKLVEIAFEDRIPEGLRKKLDRLQLGPDGYLGEGDYEELFVATLDGDKWDERKFSDQIQWIDANESFLPWRGNDGVTRFDKIQLKKDGPWYQLENCARIREYVTCTTNRNTGKSL